MTSEPRFKIPPTKRRLRLHRQKLRNILADGLLVNEGKKLVSIEELDDGVRAIFDDGTSAEGTILIGADGNNSNVRRHLLPNDFELTRLPVHIVGVVRHFTPEQAAPVRALDPLLFNGVHPRTGNFLWYSVQVCGLTTIFVNDCYENSLTPISRIVLPSQMAVYPSMPWSSSPGSPKTLCLTPFPRQIQSASR